LVPTLQLYVVREAYIPNEGNKTTYDIPSVKQKIRISVRDATDNFYMNEQQQQLKNPPLARRHEILGRG